MMSFRNHALTAVAFAAVAFAALGLAAGPTMAEVAKKQPRTVGEAARSLAKLKSHRFTAYVTGYAFWDNTPPGSAEISKPVVHRKAGGKGSYEDPVTIAVGHVIENGRQTLDFPPGTRLYIERLRKYAIVEDVCGDGHRPQDGPCHTGYKGHPWLDIYIGGSKQSRAETVACARKITAIQEIVINPEPHYPVVAGEIASACNVF